MNLSDTNPSARSIQEMQLLLEISKLLDQSLDLRDVVSPVIDMLAEGMDLKHVTTTLINRQSDEILIEAAHGLTQKQLQLGRYKVGEGVTGRVVETGKSMIVEKTSESPLYLDRTNRLEDEQEMSFLCVPILDGKKVIGALSADRTYEVNHDLQQDKRLMIIVASMISQAVKLRQEAQETKDRLEAENERLREELKSRFRPANIIGNSREMQEVYDQIAQVSKSNATVLINGETGTGKELVAHAIHYNSDRANKPFIKAHCAALPENLIESELFGHVRGAFTGANEDRKGRFQLAHGGTLFLDEIGEIPSSIQIKLLRVLQEREFEPLGSTKTIKVNVRMVAATNRDLQEMVSEGTFREDLYFRLAVFPLYVPPMRKRKADILLLADYFLERYAKENAKDIKRFASATIDMINTYHWPGNVRELENAIERAVLVAESDVIHPHHLPPTLQTAEASGTATTGSLQDLVEAYERGIITDALKSTRGNMAAAARILVTTQRIFSYKVKKHQVDPKKYAT